MARRLILLVLVLLGGFAAAVAWLNLRGEAAIPTDARPTDGTPAQIERGAYLARIGNCQTCHTQRGGVPYAGGRGIATPFGTVVAGNLTRDEATGLGRWSADHFWRALHHGRSYDGRLLYPVFPYPHFTQVSREDSDALYAFLRSLPAVHQPNRPHALNFPYDTQAALAVWRALFFRPGEFVADPARPADWNLGAYLVRGLGHCSACHGGRNALGATPAGGLSLGGGLIPMRHWYAPALDAPDQAGVADWPVEEIVALLRDGSAPRGRVIGPMADVVWQSTQHLHDADLRAIAAFLRALPQTARPATAAKPPDPQQRELGERLYRDHCADCHGRDGEGAADAAGRRVYPALAGNRTVTMEPPVNLLQAILQGGFAPATAGNPRPYGMPPFAQRLAPAEVAALATYLRSAWGAQAAPVTLQDVERYRGSADE